MIWIVKYLSALMIPIGPSYLSLLLHQRGRDIGISIKWGMLPRWKYSHTIPTFKNRLSHLLDEQCPY